MTLEIPLKNPDPDFDSMIKVLNGQKRSNKLFMAELLIDEEVKKEIIEKFFNEKNIPPPRAQRLGNSGQIEDKINSKEYLDAYRNYHKGLIRFYYKMGYNLIPDLEFYLNFSSLNKTSRIGRDTATLSRGERYWAEEGYGMIKSWKDFEVFPWKEANRMLDFYGDHLEYLTKNLPEGMKIAVQAAVFEPVMEWLFGYEGMFYAITDNPQLVQSVIDKLAGLVYKSYQIASQIDGVGAIWHGDDLAYKSGTMLAPDLLKKWLFPWYKKFGDLARQNHLPYWYHCCGNKSVIMEDLIEYVKIDAIHAFEDGCCPVIEYKQKYGDRVGIIGGVDIDKLARLSLKDLKTYLKKLIENCNTGTRYVFGSGNSICNFIPLDNYLTMLEVWQEYK